MPSHDGKLTEVKWMSQDGVAYQRAFKYSYDQLNRYTGSTYAESAPSSPNTFTSNTDGFDENNISYDAGGNILSLNRNSSTEGTTSHTAIDQLSYTYSTSNPDQLYTVADATHSSAGFNPGAGTGNYVYDNNGNLKNDPYKGLTIAYNYLNRTKSITVNAGTNQYINYTYDASGSLIRKQAYNGGTLGTQTDYIDGFVYLTVSGTTSLSYFPMPEGRVLNNGSGTYKQEYIITDQQGNARVSFQNNGSGVAVVKQETSYYGFGLQLPNSPVGLPTPPNKQLYNGGSEWQNDYSNLPDYYQTFNRNYDAALGRFVGVDPMAESAESMSTYQYAGNNPIMIDPAGDKACVGCSLNSTGYTNIGGNNFGNDDGGGASSGYLDWFGSTGGADYSGFWDSVVADANSYLNTNCPDVNVTLNAGAVAFLYNQYNANGDNGLITNLMYNNDASQSYGTDDNGSTNAAPNITANSGAGNVANVNNGNTTNYYACTDCGIESAGSSNVANQGDVFNTPFGRFGVNLYKSSNTDDQGITQYGASFRVSFNKTGQGYKSYQWIQTIYGRYSDGSTYSQVDGLNTPFYYKNTAQASSYAGLANATAYFTDDPAANVSRSFYAETTLVGIGNNGQITPLISFYWGYSNVGSQVQLYHYFYYLTPSPGQQKIISDYNKSH